MSRSRHTALFALVTVAALTLAGCAEPTEAAGGGSDRAAAKGKTPTTDVVSKVSKDEAAAKLLPAGVREAGTLRIASSVGAPPGAFYEEDGS
ncbi:ABC transporter substrate-binding protein, partial [Streptomyces sp. SID7982]|nr:ABC transporter substrate-binding protein [Streptomyces sp. SID7982]